MRKIFLSLLTLIIISNSISAKEGMWLPMLLKSLNQGDMQAMGLKLSAEDIYSVNNSSLKDAVISFGGFCTGEIISNQGLILTNHHCGYGQIQYHSSVENDYLTNGYWAMKQEEELPNPGLSATFIVKMEDVTDRVLEGVGEEMNEEERQKIIQVNMDSLTAAATKETHYKAFVRPFFYGNEYYMFITETFNDVRMVGAPPSSIGKFGGDTDNWMWPRHTGDFSLFRIYADKDNKPAEYSEDNVPYQPKHYFPISMKGVEEGDFTMVFGFPGSTQEYLTSHAIDQIKNVLNPDRIAVRAEALKVMDAQMKSSDEVRIKYASKYASVSNYWKKWIGENNGLERSNAIAKKKEAEDQFLETTKNIAEYQGLMDAFEQKYKSIEKYAQARSYFIEIPYRKVEIIGIAAKLRGVMEDIEEGKEVDEAQKEKLVAQINSQFKNYDATTDKLLAKTLFKMYKNGLENEFIPAFLKVDDVKLDVIIDDLYAKSIFNNQEELIKKIMGLNAKTAKKLRGDKAYQYMSEFYDIYFDQVRPEYGRLNSEIDSLSKIYVKVLRQLIPGTYYPDANSTLRLAFGKVEDYKARDAVEYDFYTTVDGILEKYDPENVDFNLPEKLVKLIKEEDFGPYVDKDGFMHVCFIASNHTTGGNSGSPVINAHGELIGLNFDRNWEGTMSDINYDISLCRNISVDIRYVLFIVDKFAGATHLIDEMKLVSETSPEATNAN